MKSNTKEIHPNEKVRIHRVPLLGSARFMIVTSSFLLIINVVYMRLSFTNNYLCMSYDPTDKDVKENMTKYNEQHGIGTLRWKKELTGYLLGSYFIGFLFSCILGGFLSDVWGGRRPLLWGNLISVIIFILEVPAAYAGPVAFCLCRTLSGFFSGLSSTPMITLFTKWLHPTERTFLIGITFSGFPIASIITYPVSLSICRYGFRGWESNFYIPGLIGFLSQIVFCRYVYDDPSKHPRISAAERTFLSSFVASPKPTGIPWCRLCTSLPIIAYFVSQFAQLWNWQTVALTMPTYYYEKYNLADNMNSIASSIPFAGLLVVRIFIALSFNKLFNCSRLSLTRFRKNNHLIGTIVPSVAIIMLSYLKSTQYILAIFLVTIDQSVVDFAVTGGFLASLLELAPQYAGIITGISSTLGFFSSFLSPVISGYLTKHKSNEGWSKVFYIQAGIMLFSCVFYEIFGSSERLKWLPEEEEEEDETEDEKRSKSKSFVSVPGSQILSIPSMYGIGWSPTTVSNTSQVLSTDSSPCSLDNVRHDHWKRILKF